MDWVDKVILAQRFDVSTWLVPTLNALAQREEIINLSEANRLGMDWVLKLAKVRERGVSSTPQYHTCTNCAYTGAPRCNSCSSTTADRCGSCSTQLPNSSAQNVPGAGTKSDYSKDIREVFGLAWKKRSLSLRAEIRDIWEKSVFLLQCDAWISCYSVRSTFSAREKFKCAICYCMLGAIIWDI